MRTYKNQFPDKDFNEKYIGFLQSFGFEDISWKNDSAASFYYCHPSAGIVMIAWVDDKNPSNREYEDFSEYLLEVYESEEAYQERANTMSDDIRIEGDDFWKMMCIVENIIDCPEATMNALNKKITR